VKSDECLVKVNHQVAEARAKGVTGVPFTIIDGKWAVSGGQSAPVFVKVCMIRKIAVDPPRLTAS
jgi:predicted DsbA family dithiol-disulfide isomerase